VEGITAATAKTPITGRRILAGFLLSPAKPVFLHTYLLGTKQAVVREERRQALPAFGFVIVNSIFHRLFKTTNINV
jgi:hypothetical protein